MRPRPLPARPDPTLLPSRLALAVACALGAGVAAANPNGGTVLSGQASIVSAGKTLTVTNTPGAILHWQGFSIGADELTRFVQQNARSSVLNRVTGQDPSLLLGRLHSNGRVFLINPNGIVFGAGARIDVGGLVASTLDLGDADFLAGRLRFAAGPGGAAALTQLGAIHTAAGGQVVLVAPRVENGGVVSAPGGEIVLAAGQTVQLADTANPDLRVSVGGRPGEVVNVGELLARSGRVGIHAGLIRHDGAIDADRAERGAGGEIVLRAGRIELGSGSATTASGEQAGRIDIDAGGGSVSASGRLEATASDGRGGSVRILGRHVVLPDARVDASGARGGGEILIGGDARGGAAAASAGGAVGADAMPVSSVDGHPAAPAPVLRNAETSSVGAATTLRADAGGTGDGGKVVVWADDSTFFAGGAAARGGASGGDGGFVEVSGRRVLDFRGSVDTTAARGRTGTLLLDPTDITISTAANAGVTAAPPFTGTAATSNLNTTTLQNALATSNVVVDTSSGFGSAGNISVNNSVSWTSANTLELRAHNDITLGAAINSGGGSGAGALRLVADQDGNGSGNVTINAAVLARAGISISGVNISSTAAGTLTATGASNQNGGDVTITAGGNVALGAAIVASGGNASGPAPGRNAGAVTIGGTAVGTAAITASGSNASASGDGGAGGVVQITSTAGTSTGALLASGGTAAGTNMSGGNGGTIGIANSGAGNIVTGAVTARVGAATGTGSGGAAGSLSIANTAGAVQTLGLSTQGNANGDGGSIGVDAIGPVTVTSVTSSGGNGAAGAAGGSGGAIFLRSSGDALTAAALAAGGGNGGGGSGSAGGHAGSVTVSSFGTLSVGSVSASGGNGGGTTAAGGAAATVAIDQAAGAGTLTTGTLTARSGAATGVATSAAAGSVTVTQSAAALLQTGAINVSGQAGGHGGDIDLVSAGDVTVTGTVNGSGGALNAGTAAGGRNAGNLTVRGANRTLSAGTLTASGGAAVVAGQTGGSAGLVRLTGSDGTAATAGTLVTGNVTAAAGAGSGTGAGGSAGGLVLEGSTVSAAALTTTGGTNAPGGAITVTASAGALTVTGAIASSGGNAAAGAAGSRAGDIALAGSTLAPLAAISATGSNGNGSGSAGGDGGNVSVSSGGGFSAVAITASGGNGGSGGDADGGSAGSIALAAGGADITLGGSLAAAGGNRTGTGTAGAGGSIRIQAPVLLNASTVTVTGSGGSAGLGSGGDVDFDATIDSTGVARALVVNTNAQTRVGGAIGAGSALSALTTNAAGSTRLDGGSVRTTGAMSFNDAVTLGADTTLDSGSGAIALAAVDGAFRLAATSTGNATFAGAVGGTTPLDSLVVAARTITVGSVSVGDPSGAGIDLQAARNIVTSNSTLLSNGAPITFVANPSGSTAGGYRGIRLTNVVVDSGAGDITMTGTGGTTGANNMGVQITDSTLRAGGSGRIALTGTGGAGASRGVSVTSSAAGHTVTTVDGDITFTGTGAGATTDTLSADVTWNGFDESTLGASGSGTVRLIGLGTSDYNGVTLGATTPFDYYGPALNQWQVSTASNLVYTLAGIAKSTGGDSTWTITAPRNVEFNGTAGINVTSGRLDVVIAPVSGAVRLGTGIFRTHGGDLVIGGGSNPGGRVDPTLPGTGARGNAAYVSGIGSSADIDAEGGNVWMMGTGHGGTNSGNYGVLVGTTSGTANVVTSGAGHITLTGFGGGSGASDDNVGVFLGGGTVRTGATGSISVTGTGGNTATGTRNMGVRLFAFNTTEAQGSGAITIWGRSGDGSTQAYNPGIDAAATIVGGGGPVTLTGIAGDAPGSNNIGITAIGRVTNTGTGTVTLTGTGGSHAGAGSSGNYGIGFSDAQVTTVDGNLAMTGTAGSGGGTGNHGLVFPLPGIGGYGGTSAIRSSGAGNVALTGVAGPGGTGIVQNLADLVSTTGSGRIAIAADSLALSAANAISSATDLAIRPVTAGTALNIGSAAAASGLSLDDAELALLSWGSAGTLTLGGAQAGAVTVNTAHVFSRPIAIVSGAGTDLTLAGRLASTSAAAAPAIVLDAGRNFVNAAGAGGLDAGSDRWLVYSTDPRADTPGGLPADFRQFAASFGTTPLLGSGDGFLHRLAPTLTPVLTGTVAKVYDGNASAAVTAPQLALQGAIGADGVVLAAPPSGSYDSRDVGTNKPVFVSGISLLGASQGGVPVYGYALASTTATGAVGTVTPAPLVVRAEDLSRPQGQANAPLTATLLGLVGTDSTATLGGSLVLTTAATPESAPGRYAIRANGLSSPNYAISYVDGVYEVLALPPAPLPTPVPSPAPSLAPAPALVPVPGSLEPRLAQRDLRLGVGSAVAPACLRRAPEGWSAAHWLSAPFGSAPACVPDGAPGGTR